MSNGSEVFVSVDVETSGPIPGKYDLLQIGACVVDAAEQKFAVFLKPESNSYVPEALEVTGLNLDDLKRDGVEPAEAMRSFAKWIQKVSGNDGIPVFVGLNAAFDWSFINYYFHMFVGENPFRYSALDIKSLYVGYSGRSWSSSSAQQIARHFGIDGKGNHDALCDAQFQARLFSEIYRALRPKRD